MQSNPPKSNRFALFLGFVATISIVIGVPFAFASLNFTGNNITGDSGGAIIDASGTISIGTSSATSINIGNALATVAIMGNVSTTNLSILSLGSSGSPCLTVNAAGGVATTTCGGDSSGTISYASASSIGSALDIAAWGDSLTVGNQDSSGITYPNQLQADYPGVFVYNFGISGQTSTAIASRFLADSSSWPWFNIIWSGRNDIGINSTATIENAISSMTAQLPNNNFIVMSILNNASPGAYSCALGGGSDYNQIQSVNQWLAATYPNQYLDIHTLLVNQYNSSSPQDVIDYGNCATPFHLRAVDGNGTLSQAITSFTTSFNATSSYGYSVGSIIDIGSENMYVSSISGTAPSITLTVTRGYGSTTPASYATSTSFTVTDVLHLNATGYKFVASQIASKLASFYASSSAISATSLPMGLSALQNYAGIYYDSSLDNFFMGGAGTTTAASKNNLGIGSGALQDITIGSNDIAVGQNSLQDNTVGLNNISIGGDAMQTATSGTNNIAIGYQSLMSGSSPQSDVSIGGFSMSSTTSGYSNVAVGVSTLQANLTGYDNVAVGFDSLQSGTAISGDTAVGADSLQVATGNSNTAVGNSAMISDTSGGSNVCVGQGCLEWLTTTNNNTAIGYAAGIYQADEATHNVTSSNSVYVGTKAAPLASGDSNEVSIGYFTAGHGSNTVTLGSTSSVATFVNGEFVITTSTSATVSCIKMADTDGSFDWVYASSSAFVVTSSKPSFCGQ